MPIKLNKNEDISYTPEGFRHHDTIREEYTSVNIAEDAYQHVLGEYTSISAKYTCLDERFSCIYYDWSSFIIWK